MIVGAFTAGRRSLVRRRSPLKLLSFSSFIRKRISIDGSHEFDEWAKENLSYFPVFKPLVLCVHLLSV